MAIQVTQVQLKDNTVTLWLRRPINGQGSVSYDVGDPDWFYNDFNDLIVDQQSRGIIHGYDYPQGFVAPIWM